MPTYVLFPAEGGYRWQIFVANKPSIIQPLEESTYTTATQALIAAQSHATNNGLK